MRKLIVAVNVTLDGRTDDVREWALPYNDDTFAKYNTEVLSNSDGLLLGRATYEIFAALLPGRAGELGYIDQMNGMAKHVASTTLSELRWENSHLLEGDVPAAVAELKRQPGKDLVMFGSHDLMNSLLEHDLIDEYRLWVYPVVLRSGRHLFDDGLTRLNLELVEAKAIGPGVTSLTLR
jgi:dihydrofolate reductase